MELSNEDLILLYISARDRRANRKKAYEEADLEDRLKQEDIEKLLADRMMQNNLSSISVNSGTAYLSSRSSAVIDDWGVFLEYVRESNAWDMLFQRCNKEAIHNFINQEGSNPPGVHWHEDKVVNIRRDVEFINEHQK